MIPVELVQELARIADALESIAKDTAAIKKSMFADGIPVYICNKGE